MEMQSRVLVTGAAGFIGFHLASRLLERGCQVTGIDNMNDYYDVDLKEERLKRLTEHERFRFERMDIADADALKNLFEKDDPEIVINLAAQAGVRDRKSVV